MSLFRVLTLALPLALLAACSSEQSEPAPPAEPAEVAGQAPELELPPATSQEPVDVSADAIAVGSSIGADMAVDARKQRYTTDDTIYASIPTREFDPGSQAKVYWTFEDGTTDKEETKDIAAGAEHLHFELSAADGLRAGDYNVQVDVDGQPVGIVDFSVE
ncbi:hypothetical protein [Lysobacter sp. D1-1-M9]|uniref:hypothetical protein n=1 Tax=Novilysobacter longmucuonensis TaxID=3098603 RepID=UPI002FC5E783